MPSDRLTPLDASFLHLEDASSHMHVAAVMVFEGRTPAYDDFVSYVESRLHLVPRYRQRLATVPLGQGRPSWADDPHFDIRFHVRATALPRPGGEYELQVLAARVFSQPLNRRRPLWEMWLVEGLEGGRFAIVSKTHHALVDGIAGMDILSVLFSPEERPEETWRPRPAPGGAELLARALFERATIPAEVARSATALVRRPRRLVGAAMQTAVGLGAMAWAGLSPAPPSPYNRPVGSDRRFAWVRTGLDDLKAVKNELGGTVNDVVLTVVTRALRRDLLRRGVDVEGLELKAFVPISIRGEDERGQTGNRVAGMIVTLPVSCEDTRTCLRRVGAITREMKDSGQALGARTLTELSGFAPPNLLTQGARLAARQRFINLVVTNVPGPQETLEMEGARLTDVFPMVPLGANLAFGVAIVSYDGGMNFGLVSDFDSVPELDDIAEDFEAAVQEVLAAAGVERSAPDGRDRGREAPGEGEATPAPPPEPEEPEHVDEGVAMVAEFADPGAEEGAGAQVRVEEPWPGYDGMRADDVVERLADADDEAIAVVRLYEAAHKRRARVLEAAGRALARR
jgi:WS/DGAT/MGAT family acyltransferase